MDLSISHIPKTLNSNNIDQAIKNYLHMLNEVPISINAGNVLELLSTIKRTPINKGPYPTVTLFEAANRIMTDLTILYGIKELLEGKINEIAFDEYKVEYGNLNENDHDIIAQENGQKLVGEAFNVAKTFFQGKKTTALRKLRAQKDENRIILLMYNADAVDESYRPKPRKNEYHLAVKIRLTE